MAKQKEAWDKLSMLEKALLIKLSVDNGVSSLKLIRDTYNLYADGGSKETSPIKDTSTKEYVVKKWPALGNIDFEVWKDPTFTREKTGAGSIEYFNAKYPGVNYLNGQYVANPSPGKDVIMYDPNTNDEQDVRLDALHIMPKDATYDALNALYRLAALNSDVSYIAKKNYERDKKLYGESNIDSYELYFNNEADGLLRNMFIEGTPLYIESKRYYPNIQQLREWNTHLLPYIDEIHKYMETGLRPSYILPEITVTPNEVLYKNGGNLSHKKSGDELKESQDLNYPNGVIRQGKLDILKKIVQSPVGAFTRFIDPTGILSIPDAYYDLKHLVETPTTQRTTADYIDATASIVGLFPLGNNISDFVKVKNWRQGLQLANKYAEHLPFKLVGVYPDMYLYHNQKSTGGPLYPFSFEKNPFLKTPIVRYDEGGEMVNINLPEVTVFPEETYITYTGNESKSFIPTKEEYNEFKANEIRRQALVNMNNRNTPHVPYINDDPTKPGSSCLYTFLSNYPVPLEKSNRVFWELSPEESGFKRVDTPLPGDGIQVFSSPKPHRWGSYFWPAIHYDSRLKHGYKFPSHMTMFKDVNTNGVLIRGSNGSTNPTDTFAIVEERKPISYIHPYNADIYRFVGTKELLKAWEKEYTNIYKHKNE